MFSKKHFILTADVINQLQNKQERTKTAVMFATIFKKSNPGFDDKKFFKACNVNI